VASVNPNPVGIVSLIGGECSGKSTLAAALAARLDGVLVVEQLRIFVDEHGRPPLQSEQAAVLEAQMAAELAAARAAATDGKSWVIGDPAALMTAIYSVAYFNDPSLLPEAVAHQTSYELTVWCDIDLPWQADGEQRDGPHERERVHRVIADIVSSQHLEVLAVHGPVEERVERVLAALAESGRT
jgi:nicotinamide riboside kinase